MTTATRTGQRDREAELREIRQLMRRADGRPLSRCSRGRDGMTATSWLVPAGLAVALVVIALAGASLPAGHHVLAPGRIATTSTLPGHSRKD